MCCACSPHEDAPGPQRSRRRAPFAQGARGSGGHHDVRARAPAERVAQHIASHEYELHAPQLLDLEVLGALRRVVAAGEASTARAGEAVADLLDLPVERYPHHILVPRVWGLRANFSAYDAAYLALAETLTEDGAPLLTADARFARAAGTHSGAEVLLAGDDA